MAVILFSFRIILQELGEDGYGLYNVVAGVVVLFSFLSNALTQSTQRFLSYHIGRQDFEKLKQAFSMSVNIHLLLAVSIIILAETIGLWFMNSYLQFPNGMQETANLVYQFTIATFVIQILTIPYQASIISNEKMSFYAYFSIIEAFLKLSAAFALTFVDGNKVVVYASFLTIIAICILLCYIIYCRHFFDYCVYRFIRDSRLFKEMLSFSGWNMLGGIGSVGATQGVNMILNIFRGVTLNAAMGVSNQVAGAVSSFVSNMQTAFNPQIIKSYANDDNDYFLKLVFRASRFSFLLIFIIGFPVILCCSTVFDIWLTETPDYAVPFTQMIIIYCMIDALSGPLWTAAQASGKIKTYMIIVATMIFTNIPAAYIILSLGMSPIWLMVYKVAMNLMIHFTRIGYLHRLIHFPSLEYVKQVMFPVFVYTLVAVPIPMLLACHIHDLGDNLLLMAFTILESVVLGSVILMTKNERRFVLNKISSIIHR